MKAKLMPQRVKCECGRTMFAEVVDVGGHRETVTCMNEGCPAFERSFLLPEQEVRLQEVGEKGELIWEEGAPYRTPPEEVGVKSGRVAVVDEAGDGGS